MKRPRLCAALAPPGDAPLPEPLVELLAHEAARLADQFLNIVIRAVDYCPPVDLRLGEYLRAMITADFDLVPDDPWGYREALVAGIPPSRHHRRRRPGPDTGRAALARPRAGLAVRGWDRLGRRAAAGQPMQPDERRAGLVRASAIGFYVTQPELLHYFGLAAPSRKNRIERPVVESIRRDPPHRAGWQPQSRLRRGDRPAPPIARPVGLRRVDRHPRRRRGDPLHHRRSTSRAAGAKRTCTSISLGASRAYTRDVRRRRAVPTLRLRQLHRARRAGR